MPRSPAPKDLARAKALIFEDLLDDFPFADQASRAHALALVLLPAARELIEGPTPNHLVEAPAPGSGKDLLVDCCLRPALGPHLAILAQAGSDEEWRKRITASFKQAAGAILIGNVTRPLDSGVLAAALTAPVWTDRILGRSEMARYPVRCIWTTTANNPVMSTEAASDQEDRGDRTGGNGTTRRQHPSVLGDTVSPIHPNRTSKPSSPISVRGPEVSCPP